MKNKLIDILSLDVKLYNDSVLYMDLIKIIGIGDKKAKELIKNGVKSIDDL